VAGAAGFTFKRSRSDTRFVNKVIRRCMLQQLSVLPGSDGYLCRVRRLPLHALARCTRSNVCDKSATTQACVPHGVAAQCMKMRRTTCSSAHYERLSYT
jgi:hypothetical protein